MAVDDYIYVIGGSVRKDGKCWVLTECARFNTELNEWHKIAPLNEARERALGVCKNENIFIVGGWFM